MPARRPVATKTSPEVDAQTRARAAKNVLCFVSLLPAVVHVVREKTTKSFALLYLLISLVAQLMVIAYATMLKLDMENLNGTIYACS